ncbi:hypothetical protein K501DRAFT_279973 [Backusella circina FSU 941]|nr:hypothetical protein K501DRAFT_279973 [Backusella circina FSU 941]
MKKEYLLSLIYIPLTICGTIPSKDATEKVALIDSKLEAEDPQALPDNAQSIIQDAIFKQLSEMDLNEAWNSASKDIQNIIESYNLDDYFADGQTLKEATPQDLFGGLFGNIGNDIKGLVPNSEKSIADGLTGGLTSSKPPAKAPTGILKDTKGSNNTKVDTSSVEAHKDEDGDVLGDLFGKTHNENSGNGTNGFHFSFGFNTNSTNTSSPLSGIFGIGSSGNATKGFQLPNLFNNTGSSDPLNDIFSGIKNTTNGLFGKQGLFNFGNGSGLENLVGAAGSTIGSVFNGKLLGDLTGAGKPGNLIGDFFKGVTDKVSALLPNQKPFNLFDFVPFIGGFLNFLGSAVAGLFKGLGDFAFNLFPKVGALGAKNLPGFLRYQTHEFLVDDLSHMKNIFLGAMRVESPAAADQFNIFFDKLYKILEHAHSIDPSMARALTDPSEDNLRYALKSLSKVLSDL